ncbi:MAG: NFACT RNA binding domain-containing protein [Fidelibacterota bacterium]
MITSWFTWEKLCHVMNARLKGEVFETCYSHVKSEIVIQNSNPRKDSIRIHLDQPLPFLFLQPIQTPGQKVPIFHDFKPAEFVKAEIAGTDRDIRMNFTEDQAIILRIRPPKNNVYFISPSSVDTFKKSTDQTIYFDATPVSFQSLSDDPRLNERWKKRFHDLFPDLSWPDLQQEISRANGQVLGGRFILLPLPREEFNPHHFYDNYRDYITGRLKELHFKPEKNRIMTALSSRAEKVSYRIRQLSKKEEQADFIERNRIYGDILMTMLSTLQPGQEEAEIPLELRPRDYPETIPLKPDLSPQANAQRYYNRARKLERARQESRDTESVLKKEYDELKAKITELEAIETLHDLRKWLKKNKDLMVRLNRMENPQKSATTRLPYREFFYQSWRIWVGKSAGDNDDMTFHLSHKNDLWLHTRNSTGSHVIIRREGKAHIPGHVIEYAASLAARFSEEKHASLVPVVCTERKHVVKRKGFPPGKAHYSLEKTILIKPAEIE